MKITDIINEANIRVKNSYPDTQKVTWLNELNNEFFDVVKIPQATMFQTAAGTASYALPSGVRAKNIDKVHIGTNVYPSFLYGDVQPGQNYHIFDDTTGQITLSEAPVTVMNGVVRYSRIATTTFLASNLDVPPDAPNEYHWIYILGLCEKIAKAMDDVGKANNYANDYRGNLLIAQQNYQKGA